MNIFEIILIQPLTNGLILFYKIFAGNLGLAIIGFSLFLRILLNPLTKPYLNSMKKMKGLAPELEKLKQRHKGDRIKFAQAQSDLYRQRGVNPAAGCLPYLLQIIILIAFFNVFTQTISKGGNLAENFNRLLYGPLQFSQNQTVNVDFLYLNLTSPDLITIPGLPFSLPGPVLILAALVQLLSAKVMAPYTREEERIAKKTKSESDDIQVAVQKSMIYTFPLFTLIIGMRFASGLALYWLVFSLSQVYQQVRAQGWGEITPIVEKLDFFSGGNKKK